MEGYEQAKNLFEKLYTKNGSLDQLTKEQLEKTILRLLRESLRSLNKKKFNFSQFWDVIRKTAEMGVFIPEKAAVAFKNLKIYFILLYTAPWKKEFRKLKTYCGYFQTRIRSHLYDPESIICLVGFCPDGHGVLSHFGKLEPELLLLVAFDCVVAAVECDILSEMHRTVKEKGLTYSDVVRWRETGVMPEVVAMPCDDINSGSKGSILNTDFTSGSRGFGNSRPELQGAGAGLPRNLPFIDDEDRTGTVDDTDYIEGTVDEHAMASLQLLNKSKASLRKQPPSQRPSDDWAYVRDGLTTKYGEKYYDGQRGDLMRAPRERVTVRVGNHDDASDEGIDVGEEPPAVNIQNPPVQITTRDSGYRTGPSTQVYYPPTLSSRSRMPSESPGMSVQTSAYVSQSTVPTQVPIIARGVNTRHVSDGLRNMQLVDRPSLHSSNFSGGNMVSKEWKCPTCTYLNKGVVCEMCGKSKEGPDVDGPQCGESVTVCKKCTYENKLGSDVCSMCSAVLERGSLHTFV